MNETLLGVIIGGIIGIVGTVAADVLRGRAERGRRRRDYEIERISSTVEVLDQWEAQAAAHLAGDHARAREAERQLYELDRRWDARADIIPGSAGQELLTLCQRILLGPPGAAANPDAIATLDQLMRLQSEVRTSAAKRIMKLK